MSSGPLISDSEKDKHKTRDQLLKELSELRGQLAARTESLEACESVAGMLDGITEPVVVDDKETILYANAAAGKTFGGSQEPVEGKWFEIFIYPVPGGTTILFRDATVDRQKEEIARLGLALLHNMKESVFLMRAAGRLFHMNNETQDSLGYSSDELHRMSIFDVVPPASQREWRDILDRIRQHGSMAFESRLRARDGREFPVEVYANFIEFYGHNYYTVSARDITERKEAERSSGFLASVVHTAYDAIFSITPEGIITSWNQGAEKLYGYTADETLGNHVAMLAPPDLRTEVSEALEKMRSEGLPEHYETVHQRKDGTIIDVLLTLSPIVDASGAFTGSSVIAHDITERKRADAAIIETREKYRSLVENINDMVWETDDSFAVTYASAKTRDVMGYEPREILGRLPFDFVCNEDLDRFGEAIDRALTDRKPLALLEYKIRRKDGRAVHIETNGMPVFDNGGVFKGYRGINRDVTERKQAEEALQVAKAQAELYVDLMGHDINNMNQVAMASLDLALMDLEQDGKLDASHKPLLEKSVESLTSSSQLIRNVQKLQRASTEGISLKAINATALLESVIRDFRQAPGKELTIDFSRCGDCMVSANELLKDVFVNLIGNAVKHARPDRPLSIGISADSVVEHGKKYCRFTIEDNGPGVSDEVKDRLFRRFSRGATKACGSGLGLYLVKTLVEHYGGKINIEDRVPGDYTKGAKFVVKIPAVE
jgi:PAS domain S-box-containing protein